MGEIPRYDQYELFRLYEALNNIAADRYPETFAALEKELGAREPESKNELEECYYRLDRKKWPQYAARLRRQIDNLGGFATISSEPISEAQRYRTFWRRAGALVIDWLVLFIPALVLLLLFGRPLLENPAFRFPVEQSLQYIGLAYSILMHAWFGQTLGKMSTGVKIIDVSEERCIGFGQALLRDSVPLAFTVASTAYLLVFGYGEVQSGLAAVIADSMIYVALAWHLAELVTMLFNGKRRAVHDFLARSVVIRVPMTGPPSSTWEQSGEKPRDSEASPGRSRPDHTLAGR